MKKYRRGFVRIQKRLLSELLGLPENVVIEHVSSEGVDNWYQNSVVLFLAGGDLPEQQEGCHAEQVHLEEDGDGDGKLRVVKGVI